MRLAAFAYLVALLLIATISLGVAGFLFTLVGIIGGAGLVLIVAMEDGL